MSTGQRSKFNTHHTATRVVRSSCADTVVCTTGNERKLRYSDISTDLMVVDRCQKYSTTNEQSLVCCTSQYNCKWTDFNRIWGMNGCRSVIEPFSLIASETAHDGAGCRHLLFTERSCSWVFSCKGPMSSIIEARTLPCVLNAAAIL